MIAAVALLALAQAPSFPFPKDYVALGDDAAMAVPRSLPAGPVRVVAYFHGMLPESAAQAPELSRMARAASARGLVVLALRGEQGLCDWSAEVRRHWCWPNGKRQLPQVGAVLQRLSAALDRAGAKLGRPLEAPFVAGFSNGGFLAGLLLSDSPLRPRAVAIAHGGLVDGQRFEQAPAVPVLLLSATGDVFHGPRMAQLDQALRQAGRPARVVVREGAHELTADDARAMVDFFAGQPPAEASR